MMEKTKKKKGKIMIIISGVVGGGGGRRGESMGTAFYWALYAGERRAMLLCGLLLMCHQGLSEAAAMNNKFNHVCSH